MRYKRFYLLILVVLLLLLVYTYINQNNKLNKVELEYIKQKAIALSLATYTGTESILLENSIESAQDYLINSMYANKDKKVKIKDIEINSYHINDNNTIDLFVMIEEEPFKSILFNQMTFEKINGIWKLINFGVDA